MRSWATANSFLACFSISYRDGRFKRVASFEIPARDLPPSAGDLWLPAPHSRVRRSSAAVLASDARLALRTPRGHESDRRPWRKRNGHAGYLFKGFDREV